MAQETPAFPDEVAGFFEALGFEVKLRARENGPAVTIFHCGPPTRELSITFVACLAEAPAPEDRARIIDSLAAAAAPFPRRRSRVISSAELSAEAVEEFDRAGIECATFEQAILQELPLARYAERLLADEAKWRAEHWRAEDWFIPPLGILEGEFAPQMALDAIGEWLGAPEARLLMIHGDTGIGKSTCLRWMAGRMARDFLANGQADWRAHPAPILIPLLDVRRALSWESLIESHLASQGIPHVRRAIFEHLVRAGRVVLLYDAFDEIADQLTPEARREVFGELTRPIRQGGKAILTCRTQHFQDADEQRDLLNGGGSPLGIASLALQPFSEPQVKAYLAKARPDTVADDWARINEIYHLADLAQRPMLLEKITQQLRALPPGAPFNLAFLYAEYAELWMEREAGKQRQSLREQVLRLIPEIAWTLWDSGRPAVSQNEVYSILERLNAQLRFSLSPEELQVIARDLMSASFFARDEAGLLAFNHHSFEHYFLARKLHDALARAGADGMASLLATLRTRLFDRKVALFRVALEPEPIDWPLQRILREPHQPRVSENALHLLYWSARIRCGMEEKITDLDRLRAELRRTIPAHSRLEGMELEGLDAER